MCRRRFVCRVECIGNEESKGEELGHSCFDVLELPVPSVVIGVQELSGCRFERVAVLPHESAVDGDKGHLYGFWEMFGVLGHRVVEAAFLEAADVDVRAPHVDPEKAAKFITTHPDTE